MVSVDACIHADCVEGYKACGGWEFREGVELLQELRRAAECKGKGVHNKLELFIQPASESVCDTSTHAHHRAGFPRGFMDLCCEVEVGRFFCDGK